MFGGILLPLVIFDSKWGLEPTAAIETRSPTNKHHASDKTCGFGRVLRNLPGEAFNWKGQFEESVNQNDAA